MKRLIVGGAGGKMGKTVISLAEKNGFSVVAGWTLSLKSKNAMRKRRANIPLTKTTFLNITVLTALALKETL